MQERAYSRARESITIVTGPSFTSAIFMSPPKTPRATGLPVSRWMAAQNAS
jgi:hypothetical protein